MGPNGLVRFFEEVGSGAAVLDLVSKYDLGEDSGSIGLTLRTSAQPRFRYWTPIAGSRGRGTFSRGKAWKTKWSWRTLVGWYDLIATVA